MAQRSPASGAQPSGVARTGVLGQPGEFEAADLGTNRASFLLRADQTSGRFSLTEFVMAPPPSPGPPPHAHEDSDEAVYVLEGNLEMGMGERKLSGSAGSLMLALKGSEHSLSNPGPGPARFLVILSPAGYEGFWREMAELRAELGRPPDQETVLRLQRKYHLASGGQARRFE